jgi:hypothetical protein
MPLGKVFARLDLRSGASWTVTLSHELLEMLADPWINWCAQGSDSRVYALEVCDEVEADVLGYEIDGVLVSDFVTPAWFDPAQADCFDFKRHISRPLQLASGGVYFRPRRRRLDAIHNAERSGSAGEKQAAAADYEESRVEKKSAVTFGGGFPANRRGTYFLRQRTPSLVISTNRPAEVNSARIASEA